MSLVSTHSKTCRDSKLASTRPFSPVQLTMDGAISDSFAVGLAPLISKAVTHTVVNVGKFASIRGVPGVSNPCSSLIHSFTQTTTGK